jgi:lipopolysaccharide/colanic/teichoic acid biosynthesis glycosyltransferase
MANNAQGNADIGNSTGVAAASTAEYGYVSSPEAAADTVRAAVDSSLWTQLQFLWGEYFKGILFVLASTVFILAVPALVTRKERVVELAGMVAKRTMDIAGSLLGLLLTLPFWLIVPVLIKVDSRGPVFYTQTRVGRDRREGERRYCQRAGSDDRRCRDRRRENWRGQLFKVIKFRTMVNDAEGKSGPVWARKNDPRVTRLGRFLRKTRIDEIPQFINVLKGDMSLVGPRPERPKFVDELKDQIPDYTRRLSVKPGLTGLAQVETGYDSSLASVRRKLARDLSYIENQSVWLDLKIMARTVIVVLTGKGAC